MTNLQVQVINNRLILGGNEFDNNRTDNNQKEGINCLTGLSAKVQKKLGLAEDVTINGKTYTINKKSRNKWLARTTPDFAVKTIGSFSKSHAIIDQAIQESEHKANILANHVLAQGPNHNIHYKDEKNLTKDNVISLFDDEANALQQNQEITELQYQAKTTMADIMASINLKIEDELAEQQRLDGLQLAIRPQEQKEAVDAARKLANRAPQTQKDLDAQSDRIAKFKAAQADLVAKKAALNAARRQKVLDRKKALALSNKAWESISGADIVSGKAKSPQTLAKTEEAKTKAVEIALVQAEAQVEKAKGKLHGANELKPTMAQVLAGKASPKKELAQAALELQAAEKAVEAAKLRVVAHSTPWGAGLSGADIVSGKVKSPQAAKAEILTPFKRAGNKVIALCRGCEAFKACGQDHQKKKEHLNAIRSAVTPAKKQKQKRAAAQVVEKRAVFTKAQADKIAEATGSKPGVLFYEKAKKELTQKSFSNRVLRQLKTINPSAHLKNTENKKALEDRNQAQLALMKKEVAHSLAQAKRQAEDVAKVDKMISRIRRENTVVASVEQTASRTYRFFNTVTLGGLSKVWK